MKIDIEEKGMKIPIVEYEVYQQSNDNDSKHEKLDLTECKDTNIDISIPVKLEQELYKHNASDEYYNNKCFGTTSDSGTDICLKDRRNNFIEQNLTLCEDNCILIDYNYTNKRAKCNCKIKIKLPTIDENRIDKNKLLKSFTDVKGYFTNIDVVKCYKTVFKKKVIVKNIGFFIWVTILFFLSICFILFYYKYFEELIKKIYTIVHALEYKNSHKSKALKNNNNNINVNIFKANRNNKMILGKKLHDKINNQKEQNKNKFILKNNIISNSNSIKSYQFKKKLNQKNKSNIAGKKKPINNNKSKNIYKALLEYNDNEKNELSYEEALKYDKRTFFQYYYSLLKIKNIFFFSFFPNNDYNSRIIKIFLFFFNFFTQLTINALYFTDDTMHKIYIDKGKFDFIYQIPQIIFSSLISYVIDSLINYLSLSENDIIKIKEKKEVHTNVNIKVKKVILRLKIKFSLFFSFSLVILFAFGFYITCFCGVYKNTQIHLITDTGMSFIFSLVTPFIINLFPSIFRIISLRDKNKNRKLMYKLSSIFEML